MWNGQWTVYDMGTAVFKEYRGRGITSMMLAECENILKKKGIQQYLLEVIQENHRAFSLYQKNGFEIVRELRCYQGTRERWNLSKRNSKIKLERVPDLDWDQVKRFWDYPPSWQNSIDSVRAVIDGFVL